MSETATAAPAASPESTATSTAEATSTEATSTSEGSGESSSNGMAEAIANQEAAQAEANQEEGLTPEEEAELAAEESKNTESEKEGEESTESEASSKFKVKIDGKEVELTEDELKQYASLGKAAQTRMQEAAEVRKQHEKLQNDVNTLMEILQSDPARILNDLGVDPHKFAEEMINKKIEEEAKSPEQKEKEKLMKDLEDAQSKIKEAEEQRKKEEQERLTTEAASKIEKEINDAIEANDAPKDPAFIRKVADLLLIATSQNIDIDVKDVIPIAKKQFVEQYRALAKILPEETLEEILGDEKVSSLRKRYLKKLKKTPPTVKDIKSTGTEKRETEEEKTPIKSKDFFSKLGTF